MAVFQPTYKDPKTGDQKYSSIWWYEFTIAGKRVRESAKTTRKTVAQQAEKNRRLELEKSLAGMPVEKRENRIRSVEEVVKAYLANYKVGHREKSVLFAQNRLAHVRRLLGNLLLPDVNEDAILRYTEKRLSEKTSEAEDCVRTTSGRTINAEIGELSRAIGKPRSVLWPKVKPLEERKDVGRALSPEEEGRLLEAACKANSKTIGTFIRVALLTGMRYGEIAGLQWGRVDLAKKVLTVGKAKTSAGTGRQIPLSTDLAVVLEMHRDWFLDRFGEPEPEHYLFPFGSPLPVDPTKPTTTIKTVWNSLRKAAKVSCRLHDLRHTAATKMAEAGVPESTMLALMGHMSRAMLERYSHIRMAAKRQAVEALTLRTAVLQSVPKEADATIGVPKESPKVSKDSRPN